MYSLTTISVCSMELFKVFNVFHQLLCIVSFTEADWQCYKLEWKQALSGTFMVIHQRSIVLFQRKVSVAHYLKIVARFNSQLTFCC